MGSAFEKGWSSNRKYLYLWGYNILAQIKIIILVLIVYFLLNADSVRYYCEDCSDYKYTTQTVIDTTWIPMGCEDHNLKDFVVSSCDTMTSIIDSIKLESEISLD